MLCTHQIAFIWAEHIRYTHRLPFSGKLHNPPDHLLVSFCHNIDKMLISKAGKQTILLKEARLWHSLEV